MSGMGLRWIHWQTPALCIDFLVDAKGNVRLQNVRRPDEPIVTASLDQELDDLLPIVQLRLGAEGSSYGTSERLVFSESSERLVYSTHRIWTENADVSFLEFSLRDPVTRIDVSCKYCIFGDIPVVRSTVELRNDTETKIHVRLAAALSIGWLNRGHEQWWSEYKIAIANNTNNREAQWKLFDLPDLGIDDVGASDFDKPGTRAAVIKSSFGTFSTGTSLPMGALTRNDNTRCFLWQIEHSGAWRWEVGNITHGLYLVAGGPTDQDHSWAKLLAPGQSFTSVSTALAVVSSPMESAFTALTEYRRRVRRKHTDNEALPVIFNDYMNCLKGDPTEVKVSALIEPARQAGAEYFVIDAGWYADNSSWWDSVGAWEPSKKRFPSGLHNLLSKIRSAGMIPGLWIEPEVIGVRSPVAKELPDEAFFLRNGSRVTEQDRYHLDFRHKSVVQRLDAIVNKFVQEMGVGYFKFDYNINVTHGTDVNAESSGDGMLGHRRAYLAWINGIYDRFPHVVLENCSSGGMRLDYHMLATHSIQSTSDQQDPIMYAAISASVPTAVTPEQSASWAYPQPDYDSDKNAFCMVNSLLGRVHLSGRIDLLDSNQLKQVVDAVSVYKDIRQHLPTCTPFWPLGLPRWRDDWLTLGMTNKSQCYLAVWRRGGSPTCSIPLSRYKGRSIHTVCLFPNNFDTGIDWQDGILNVHIPASPSARLLEIVL